MKCQPSTRLVLLTCVWRRPALTGMVLGAYRRIQEILAPALDLHLLAVGSEGEASRWLSEENGFDYLEHPNNPLSYKWNAGVIATRSYDPDGVVIVGSDDLISANAFPLMAEKLAGGVDFFGISDLYFFDVTTRRLGHWAGYGDVYPDRQGEPIGCGRSFSRNLLERTGWNLWPSDGGHEIKLDNVSLRFLGSHGFRPHSATMEELGIRAVDVKVGPNLTPFQRYRYRDTWTGDPAVSFLAEWLEVEQVAELVGPDKRKASA